MLAPYTKELASMYEENKEVVFYRDKSEFVQKIQYYLEHNEERNAIANAGYERVIRDGHEVRNRVWQIVRAYESISKEQNYC